MTNDESAIDRELREALDVTPSAEFVAGVRMRIASEPDRSPWWAWSRTAVTVLAMGIVFVAAALVFRPHHQTSSRSADVSLPARAATVVAQDSSPAAATPAVSRPAVASPVAAGSAPARRVASNAADARVVAAARHQPTVLVSRAETRGLQRLIVLANQGDPGLDLLLSQWADPVIPDIKPDEIVIAPITIEPLASDTQ